MRHNVRVAAPVVPLAALASFGWLALLVSAPVLPSAFAAVLYLVGSFICHQIPERSFHLGAFQLPVCARCLGIYAGAALGTLAAAVRALPRRPLRVRVRMLTLVAVIPTAMTVAMEWAGVWQPSNQVRAWAGLPLGLAVAFVVTCALATIDYGECAPPRPTRPGQPPTPI